MLWPAAIGALATKLFCNGFHESQRWFDPSPGSHLSVRCLSNYNGRPLPTIPPLRKVWIEAIWTRRLSQNKYRTVPRYASGWAYLCPAHVTSVTLLKMASYGEGD